MVAVVHRLVGEGGGGVGTVRVGECVVLRLDYDSLSPSVN